MEPRPEDDGKSIARAKLTNALCRCESRGRSEPKHETFREAHAGRLERVQDSNIPPSSSIKRKKITQMVEMEEIYWEKKTPGTAGETMTLE